MVLPVFNPDCLIREQPLYDDFHVVIVDQALRNPDALVDYAAANIDRFRIDRNNNYPGPELALANDAFEAYRAFFAARIAPRFAIAEALPVGHARMSIATQPPETLFWNQRMCHTDDKNCPPGQRSCAAVTYLFHNDALGGTGFYRLRPGTDYRATALAYEKADDAGRRDLAARFPFLAAAPAYLTASNEFAELIAVVPAAWNRVIFYRADVPHSPHLLRPDLLVRSPRKGRMSMNVFLRCRLP